MVYAKYKLNKICRININPSESLSTWFTKELKNIVIINAINAPSIAMNFIAFESILLISNSNFSGYLIINS